MTLKDWFLKVYSNPLDRWLLGAAILLCFSSFALYTQGSTPGDVVPKEEPQSPASQDLWIPEGHVLVPIQLENSSSLEAILGSHGIVDIYRLQGESNQAGQLLGATVKIIRSLEDPRQWSALLPRAEARRWIPDGSRLFAVVQNRERPLGAPVARRKATPRSPQWNVEFFEGAR